MKYYSLFLILFLISCSSKKNTLINNDIIFNVNIEKDEVRRCEKNGLKVDFFIKNNKKIKSIINISNFSKCLTYEKKEFGVFNDITSITNKFKFSHFIIENETNEFKLFDELFNWANCSMCLSKEQYDVDLNKKSNTLIKETKYICSNELQIGLNNKKTRIWYAFIPNEKQIKNGYLKTLIKSNWFKLK